MGPPPSPLPPPPPLWWVGCFANTGADRINGHIWHQSVGDCSTRAASLTVPGFGMEYPQGAGQAGLAQCLPLSTVPPAMAQVADAECEVETYNGFRLGGGSRLAVYVRHVWVGCFANTGADRNSGQIRDQNGRGIAQSVGDCSTRAASLNVAGFGMEYPQGFGQAGSAECLPLSSVPPAMTQVADAECEVETYDGFRLGGSSRLAVYLGYLN